MQKEEGFLALQQLSVELSTPLLSPEAKLLLAKGETLHTGGGASLSVLLLPPLLLPLIPQTPSSGLVLIEIAFKATDDGDPGVGRSVFVRPPLLLEGEEEGAQHGKEGWQLEMLVLALGMARM